MQTRPSQAANNSFREIRQLFIVAVRWAPESGTVDAVCRLQFLMPVAAAKHSFMQLVTCRVSVCVPALATSTQFG